MKKAIIIACAIMATPALASHVTIVGHVVYVNSSSVPSFVDFVLDAGDVSNNCPANSTLLRYNSTAFTPSGSPDNVKAMYAGLLAAYLTKTAVHATYDTGDVFSYNTAGVCQVDWVLLDNR
jgi:hypothetical protein